MRRNHLLVIGLAAGLLGCEQGSAPLAPSAPAADLDPSLRTIVVSTAPELQSALRNAEPGDEIVVRPGTYTGQKGSSTSGYSNAYFYSGHSGTDAHPIIVRSEDPDRPAELKGTSNEHGYVLYLTGDYWQVRDLKFSTGQKAIMLDNANHDLIFGCETHDTGQEGIHLRDGSSYNTVQNCDVHDTGQEDAGTGEGIYVGDAYSAWDRYGRDPHADHNVIRHNTVGPNVTAEHIDIKEGTVGTIVEHNTFLGAGITGLHYADSFMDVKGNGVVVSHNVGYQQSNPGIVDAFQVHNQLDDWGTGNEFDHNKLYMDDASAYVVHVSGGAQATVCKNKREPEGHMYRGNVTEC